MLLETCCEARHELATASLPLCDREEITAWFGQCTGLSIRQILHDETPNWCVDPGLELCDVSWEVAKDFKGLRQDIDEEAKRVAARGMPLFSRLAIARAWSWLFRAKRLRVFAHN